VRGEAFGKVFRNDRFTFKFDTRKTWSESRTCARLPQQAAGSLLVVFLRPAQTPVCLDGDAEARAKQRKCSMFRRKLRWVALAATGLTCAAALAANFTWSGAGSDDDWDTCNNWVVLFPQTPCYPDDTLTTDDATIPYTGGGHDVNLITETMDDLTILGTVRFGTAGGSPTLTVDTIVISGGSSGSVVTMTGATIKN
jgi:hypothetical protein